MRSAWRCKHKTVLDAQGFNKAYEPEPDEGNESRKAAGERQLGEKTAKWSMRPPISEPASEMETPDSLKLETSALELCEGQALSAARKERV